MYADRGDHLIHTFHTGTQLHVPASGKEPRASNYQEHDGHVFDIHQP